MSEETLKEKIAEELNVELGKTIELPMIELDFPEAQVKCVSAKDRKITYEVIKKNKN